jgi:hypothetical protein
MSIKGKVLNLFLFFSREQLSKLISALNEQKGKIKKTGIVVDGRKYNIKFTGTCNTYIILCSSYQ